MNIQLELKTKNAIEDIEELNDFIREENLSGVITKIAEAPAKEGTMDIGSYMPIIQMVLGSTVVAAGVKGVFDILKKWFELQQHKITTELDKEKMKSETKKVTLTKKNKDNETEVFSMSLFNEDERKQFMEFFAK